MYEKIYHTKALKNYSFLITEGAGFIGSNLVEYLLKYGVKKVRVLDDLSNGFYENLQEFENNSAFEFIEGDIRNLETCKKACKNIDLVSHQAALGSVPRSIKDPITTNEVNISGHLNMLVAIKESNIKKMVYAASSSTYGDSEELPKVESRIGKPLSPYAITKLVNELYADVFSQTYGVKTIGLRYFNIFGSKQSPNGAYAAVIPLFINAIMEKKPMTINGDGSQSRDFIFVENAVKANIIALLSNDSANNQIYNIACGKKTSLNDLVNQLQVISNVEVTSLYRSPRQGDIKDSLADISKAKKFLNYQPEYSFEEGLKITFNWFKNRA